MIVSALSQLIILGRFFESQNNLEMDAAIPSFGDDWARRKTRKKTVCPQHVFVLYPDAPAKGSDNSLVTFFYGFYGLVV